MINIHGHTKENSVGSSIFFEYKGILRSRSLGTTVFTDELETKFQQIVQQMSL